MVWHGLKLHDKMGVRGWKKTARDTVAWKSTLQKYVWSASTATGQTKVVVIYKKMKKKKKKKYNSKAR